MKPLVVSLGEPSGIGPDIILKAFSESKALSLAPFYVQGCSRLLEERSKMIGLNTDIFNVADLKTTDISEVFKSQLPVVQAAPLESVEAGTLSPLNSEFVIQAIKNSVTDIHNDLASGLVTGPIHKGVLYNSGFKFPGHTEYLASLASDFSETEYRPVMMLASDELRVVPVTIHVPIADVPDLLTKELIIDTVTILARDLTRRFGINNPHIIVTGLNPHAGEDGTIGMSEIDIISPAIKELCEHGLNVSGPYSADTCFHPRARAQYDAAVTMYHDQGLIPIKTLSFDDGVNVTLGLPFIRTSPDHGTALDIAGTGKAQADSFIAALKMATDMSIYSTQHGNDRLQLNGDIS